MLLTLSLIFRGINEQKELANDFPGDKSQQHRTSHAISSTVIFGGAVRLATAIIFSCIHLVKPATVHSGSGETYYIRSNLSGDCKVFSSQKGFFLDNNDPLIEGYSPYSCAEPLDQPLSTPYNSPTIDPDSSAITPTQSGEAESVPTSETIPPTYTPGSSNITDDSLVYSSRDVPGAGPAQKLSLIQDGNFYQSVQLVYGEWVRGGAITAIGMHRDVYDVIPLDDHVWVISFGTPHGGENFITADDGATWSPFLPEGFTPGSSEPSFLENAKAGPHGYSIITNYPSWVTQAGEGKTFVSKDGVQWERK
ncbi:MAG: hypothetical protein Q3974_01835 [Rothia sp. (in: high G+C Gram-positive bacteria)]|nr:hypothetical protein [Rothia sp. (in: high G+C Gram-positive bacteria)]